MIAMGSFIYFDEEGHVTMDLLSREVNGKDWWITSTLHVTYLNDARQGNATQPLILTQTWSFAKPNLVVLLLKPNYTMTTTLAMFFNC